METRSSNGPAADAAPQMSSSGADPLTGLGILERIESQLAALQRHIAAIDERLARLEARPLNAPSQDAVAPEPYDAPSYATSGAVTTGLSQPQGRATPTSDRDDLGGTHTGSPSAQAPNVAAPDDAYDEPDAARDPADGPFALDQLGDPFLDALLKRESLSA